MTNPHAKNLMFMLENGYTVPSFIKDAAAEIDRLETELSAWHSQFGNQLSHAVAAMDKLKADRDRLRFVLRQIICDMPQKRDWLDPNLEREARELTGKERS